jgi:O-antigen ligase
MEDGNGYKSRFGGRRPSAAPVGALREPGWDLLLVLVATYLADAVGHFQELFPVLIPLKLPFIAAAGATGLYLAHQSGLRRLAALRGRTTTAVLLLLCWAALSVPGALNRGTAFFALTQDYYKSVVLYFLVAGAVRGLRDVERLAFVYYGSVVFYGAIVLARFHVGGGDDWRLADLYYYDANDFATLAVTAIPLGLYFSTSRRWRSPVLRLASAAGLAILTLAFVRAGSRGGFLAILALALFVLFGYRAIAPKWRVAGIAIVALVLVATASGRFWTQMQTIFHSDQDYNQTSDSGRMHIWARGLGYMFSHPIFGVGLRNFGEAEGTISSLAQLQQYHIGVRWNTAHNSFVLIGAELGIPGFIFFLTMLAGAYGALRRVGQAQPATDSGAGAPASLAQALMGSMVGFVVGGFFLSLAYHQFLYALISLSTGLAKVTLRRPFAATGARLSILRVARRSGGAIVPASSSLPPT